MDESKNGSGESQDGAGNLKDDAGKTTDNAAEEQNTSEEQKNGKKVKNKKERKKRDKEPTQETTDQGAEAGVQAAAATIEANITTSEETPGDKKVKNKKEKKKRDKKPTQEATDEGAETGAQAAAIIAENAGTLDEAPEGRTKKAKKPRKMANIKLGKKEFKVPVRRIVWSSVALFLVVLLVLGGVFIYPVLFNPMLAFGNTPQASIAPVPSDADTTTDDNTGDDTDDADLPTPTIDPLDLLGQKADKEISSKDILNVALIGYDHADERDKWGWKNFYSDVMIVLAINFKENKVDMISCPRDTYSPIYNKNGKYKLNSSMYWGVKAGGGDYDNPEDRKVGYQYVCKSMQTVIGGPNVPPIDYYIAVDMPAVKTLVDKIGGVDFNIDVDFAIQGRSYTVGPMHMDGQAVLDYFRVRKKYIDASESGDLNRVDRQKDLLVGIFTKLKSSRKLIDLPDLLVSLAGQVDTNMNLQQLGALAYFGMKLDEKSITMETMPGRYAYFLYNWNYVILNASGRNELINRVYGIDPKDIEQHTSYYNYGYVNLDWFTKIGKHSISMVQAKLDADAKLPPEQQKIVEPTLSAVKARISELQAALGTKNSGTIEAADRKFQKDIDSLFYPLGIKFRRSVDDLWQYQLPNSQDQLSG